MSGALSPYFLRLAFLGKARNLPNESSIFRYFVSE
jgi:hypothetical protein